MDGKDTVHAPSLLLLVPAYNEEVRIEPVLRQYAEFFRRSYSGTFKLVVVLNGCRDNTLGVVQRVATNNPSVTWLDFPAPIGKGGALIEGLKLASEADLIGFVDADGATSPSALLDLVKRMGPADCAIGSRRLPGSVIHQAQPGNRNFASRVFHFIVQSLFRMNISDTQCGAKVMTSTAAKAIQPDLLIADMAFDINLLVSLNRAGFSIQELPTEWTDKAGSKVVLVRTSLTMFLSVVRVRLMYSPLRQLLCSWRPVELWIYRRLRAPAPLPLPAASGAVHQERPSSELDATRGVR